MNPMRDKIYDKGLGKTLKRSTVGAVLVEFALILPVMVTLMLGIIEASWALYIANTLTDVALEGARLISTQNVSNNYVISQMDSLLATANIPIAPVSITFTPNAFSLQAKGALLTVAVSVPYSSVSILPSPLFLRSVNLSSTITMVKEY